MLTRQKTILKLLSDAGQPLSRTVFVKLVFLLRYETGLKRHPSFYDFVPYKYGPFSFSLYSDLAALQKNGYVSTEEERVELCGRTLDRVEKETDGISPPIEAAVADILSRYGRMSQSALIRHVYIRHPWFAVNSELPERDLVSARRPAKASAAVYTAGYEGKSVEAFFDNLLRRGIVTVVDVRANPISRKYGFSRSRFGEICKKLGLEYRHVPTLGIPSEARAGLSNFASYQRLLDLYEQRMLPQHSDDVKELGCLMRRQPAVLVCVENDVRCCHRSRLAKAVAQASGLEVVHL